MIPLPLLLDAGAGWALAATAATAALALWWWSRRLTFLGTPATLEAWRRRLGPGDRHREAAVVSWAALHDGLGGRGLRRRARRVARCDATLAARLHGLRVAAGGHRRACEAFVRVADPVPPRRLFGGTILNGFVTAAVAAADLLLAQQALSTPLGGLRQWEVLAVCLPLAVAFVVLGRLLAGSLLARPVQWGRGAVAVGAVLVLAGTLASLRADHWPRWVVIALAPTLVSVVGAVLAHPASAAHEAAERRAAHTRRRLARQVRQLHAALRRAAAARSDLAAAAAGALVARPRVGLGGSEATPLTAAAWGADVTEVLTSLGVLVGTDVVAEAHATLRALGLEALHRAPTGEAPRPGLRSVA